MNILKPFAFFVLLISFACSNSNDGLNEIDNQNKLFENEEIYFSFSETSNSIINRIETWSIENNVIEDFNASDAMSNDTPVDFSFENAISYFDENGKETIIVNQVGLSSENNINYALTFENNLDNNLYQFMIIKTISESEDVLKVENYNFQSELIYTSIFDSRIEEISIILPDYLKAYGCNSSWGQNTMDCLQDVYTNHGWASVWATVQSAFIPQTAVALAAACAYDALTSGACEEYVPIP